MMGLAFLAAGASTNGPAEVWLTNAVAYPRFSAPCVVHSNRFSEVQAEFLVDTVMVSWTPSTNDPATAADLYYSSEEPGHWPARDWRCLPLVRHGPRWVTSLPIEAPEVPVIYWIAIPTNQTTEVSPMRLCRPMLLGLELPTRVFWPFLEGFEEGTGSWRWLAGGPPNERFQISTLVRNGKAALSVTIPAGSSSAAIGTTRVRGWRLVERNASGISLWLRTRQSQGRARFALLSDAFTTNQVVVARPEEVTLGKTWQRVDLLLSTFPKLAPARVDFFMLEFLGEPGMEFLVDDLQLLGHWELD